MNCRHCSTELNNCLIDLGSAPPSNSFLTAKTLREPETWLPLRVLVCEACWLVQTEDYACATDLFHSDYAYFSGYSSSWLLHCEEFVNQIAPALELDSKSLVVEVASNDGSLLKYFKAKGINCLGVEPTESTAEAARKNGIQVVQKFFSSKTAKQLKSNGYGADLMIANNVLAHVPDINDFVLGFSELLNAEGVVTFEFPHVYQMIKNLQFDTIYHEHFCYLSLKSVESVLSANGLSIFNVEEIDTHGGSLRVYAQKSNTGIFPINENVPNMRSNEQNWGVCDIEFYNGFQAKCNDIKYELVNFLMKAKRSSWKVAGYGAAAKANTLLNFAGIKQDLLHYVIDKNPNKQSKFMPGSRIPVRGIEYLSNDRPDFIIIFPWNIKDEISKELTNFKDWTGKIVTFIPEMEIL